MSHDRQSPLLERPNRRRNKRPENSPFGTVGERIARTFGGFERTRAELPAWESDIEPEYEPLDETDASFPIARQGYDRAAVDDYVESVETELEQLRNKPSVKDAVAQEIESVGERTSAILIVAHEQADAITKSAKEDAERCLAEARAGAARITAEATQRARDLERETTELKDQRTRLIEDARNVATALCTLAEEAAERFTDNETAA